MLLVYDEMATFRVKDEAMNRFLEFAASYRSNQESFDMATPEGKLVLQLVNSDIVTIKADACVSSVHRTKVMKECELSAHILKHGGSALQKELTGTNNKKELKFGQIVHTTPCELSGKFKRMMFVCIYKWMEGNDETLQNSVKECLVAASDAGYDSIVFPPLGMKGLGYPPFLVGMAMMKAIHDFNTSVRATSLKDVYICLFNNTEDSIRTFLQVVIAYMTGRENIILRGVQMFKGLESDMPAPPPPAKWEKESRLQLKDVAVVRLHSFPPLFSPYISNCGKFMAHQELSL